MRRFLAIGVLLLVAAPLAEGQVSAASSYGGQNVHGVQDWPLGAGIVARWYWSAPGHATIGEQFTVNCGGGIALGATALAPQCQSLIVESGCSIDSESNPTGTLFVSVRWKLNMDGPVCTMDVLLRVAGLLDDLVAMRISMSVTDPHYVNPLDVNVLAFPDTNVTLDGELDVAVTGDLAVTGSLDTNVSGALVVSGSIDSNVTGDLVLAGSLEAILSGAVNTTGNFSVDAGDTNVSVNAPVNATVNVGDGEPSAFESTLGLSAGEFTAFLLLAFAGLLLCWQARDQRGHVVGALLLLIAAVFLFVFAEHVLIFLLATFFSLLAALCLLLGYIEAWLEGRGPRKFFE